MLFRPMDPFFMASNCSFALQNCNLAKCGQIRLTNNASCDVDAFMEILFKWRGEKLESPLERDLAFPLLNISLASKTWRFAVVALGTMQIAQDKARQETNVM